MSRTTFPRSRQRSRSTSPSGSLFATYLLTRQAIGNTGALFAMLAIMLPAFLLAMYEKDGLPFEKVIRNIVRVKFTRPGIRPYRTKNIYASFARKEEPIEQSKKAEKRK